MREVHDVFGALDADADAGGGGQDVWGGAAGGVIEEVMKDG